jgi:hypothetical protein
VIVPEEAAVVRRIFGRYLEGATFNQISTELNQAGSRGRHGGLWRTSTLGNILDNPAYAGLTIYGEHTYPARWEAIVDPELWRAVQKERLPENRGSAKRKEGTGGPYLLTGFIVCGLCGSVCHHHRRAERMGAEFRCFKYHHGRVCRGGGTSERNAERVVVDAVLRRVRYLLVDIGFVGSRAAWDAASVGQRRAVLASVIDKVVIEPRGPGEGANSRRCVRIEWKEQPDLKVTAESEPEERSSRRTRPDKNRAARELRKAASRRQATEKMMATRADWNAIRDRLRTRPSS